MSNVYVKLQQVRNELSKCEMKKSGKNQKFNYFELSDFLPKVTELCNKNGICSIIKFGNKMATLKVIDVEKPESTITFTTPIAAAKLPGNSQPVQNLGATQTYIRRYLYMNAFEISENDFVDSSNNEETKKQEVTQKQIKALYTCASAAGKNDDDVKAWIKQKWNYTSTKELSKAEYDELYKVLASLGKNNNK